MLDYISGNTASIPKPEISDRQRARCRSRERSRWEWARPVGESESRDINLTLISKALVRMDVGSTIGAV